MAPRVPSPARFTMASVDIDEDAITPVTILYPPRPLPPPPAAPRPPLPPQPDRTLSRSQGKHSQIQTQRYPAGNTQQHSIGFSSNTNTSSNNKWYSPFKKLIRGISGLLPHRSSHRSNEKQSPFGPVASSSTKSHAVHPVQETRHAPTLDGTSKAHVSGKLYYNRTERNRLLCATPLCIGTENNEYNHSKSRAKIKTKDRSRHETETKTSNHGSVALHNNGRCKRASIGVPNTQHFSNDNVENTPLTSPVHEPVNEEVTLLAARHEHERDQLYERHRLQEDELERQQREELDSLFRKQQAEREGFDGHGLRIRGTTTAIRQPQDEVIAARPDLSQQHKSLSIPTSQHERPHAGVKETRYLPEATIYRHRSPHPTLQEARKHQEHSDQETEKNSDSVSSEVHYFYPRAIPNQPKHPRLTASDPLPERQQHPRQQIRRQRTHPFLTHPRPPTLPQSSPSHSSSPNKDNQAELLHALQTVRNGKQAAILRRQYLERYKPYKMRPLDGEDYAKRYGPPKQTSDAHSELNTNVTAPLEPQPALMGDILGLPPSVFSTPADIALGRSDSERARKRVRPVDEHGNAVPETPRESHRMRMALEGVVDELFRHVGLEAQMGMIEWLDWASWGRARKGDQNGWVFPTDELRRRWEMFGGDWGMIERNMRRESEDGWDADAVPLVTVRWERMPLSVLRTVWTYLWEWEDFWDREEIERGRHFFPSLSHYHGGVRW